MSTDRQFRYRCEPAFEIIRKLGGVRPLARRLGVSVEEVSRWSRPVETRGTGGKVPERHWQRLVPLAVEAGMDEASLRQGLRTALGRTRTEDERVNSAKAKGDRFERQVATDLTAAGVPAHRVPLSGAVPGYAGDVRATAPGGEMWVIQCKVTTNKRTPKGRAAGASGRGAVVRFLGQVSFGRVVCGRTVYWAMRQPVFVRFLLGEAPQAANVPVLRLKSDRLIAGDIKGHDALVFRRDQAREWMALVREG